MEWLRTHSVRRRQRACQSKPIAAAVELRRSDDGAAFAGLQSCGSATCPNCGPSVARHRREEIEQAVRLWAEHSRPVLFGTLTLRHDRGHSLAFLLDAVAAAWKAATNGRAWARDRRDHGIRAVVRVWEVRLTQNGWHVHVHFLAFADAGHTGDGLLASMFDRWSRAARRFGLRAPLLRAQDLHRVEGDPAAAAASLGDYFSKDAEAAGRAAPDAIALEMTAGTAKVGRYSLGPGQLLERAIAEDDGAGRLWSELELAMESRRTIAWTKGARDLFGLAGERTDEEVAAELPDASEREPAVVLGGREWSRLVRAGLRGPLLAIAARQELRPADIVRWLAARGLHAWLAAPPPEEDDP